LSLSLALSLLVYAGVLAIPFFYSSRRVKALGVDGLLLLLACFLLLVMGFGLRDAWEGRNESVHSLDEQCLSMTVSGFSVMAVMLTQIRVSS
jgi:ABC-type Fe3+ transport system permease subunit